MAKTDNKAGLDSLYTVENCEIVRIRFAAHMLSGTPTNPQCGCRYWSLLCFRYSGAR